MQGTWQGLANTEEKILGVRGRGCTCPPGGWAGKEGRGTGRGLRLGSALQQQGCGGPWVGSTSTSPYCLHSYKTARFLFEKWPPGKSVEWGRPHERWKGKVNINIKIKKNKHAVLMGTVSGNVPREGASVTIRGHWASWGGVGGHRPGSPRAQGPWATRSYSLIKS